MAIADKWGYYLFDEVGSTNDVIKDYCGESGKYVAVVAESQTLGRGRLGRNWKSPKEIYFFLWRLSMNCSGLENWRLRLR